MRLLAFVLVSVICAGCAISQYSQKSWVNPSSWAHDYAKEVSAKGQDSVLVIDDWDIDIDAESNFHSYILMPNGNGFVILKFIDLTKDKRRQFRQKRVLRTQISLDEWLSGWNLYQAARTSLKCDIVLTHSGKVRISRYVSDGKVERIKYLDGEEEFCGKSSREKQFFNLVRFLRTFPDSRFDKFRSPEKL